MPGSVVADGRALSATDRYQCFDEEYCYGDREHVYQKDLKCEIDGNQWSSEGIVDSEESRSDETSEDDPTRIKADSTLLDRIDRDEQVRCCDDHELTTIVL